MDGGKKTLLELKNCLFENHIQAAPLLPQIWN